MRRHIDRRTLHAWLDGEVDEATRGEVVRHLERCAACRRRLGDIETFLGRFDALRGPLAPRRELWSGIERRVREAGSPGGVPARRESPASGRRAVPDPRRRRAFVAVAGGALLAGGALVFLSRPAPDAAPAVRSADTGVRGSEAGIAGIERAYGPVLDRLSRLVEERSRGLDFDLAASAEVDLAIIRASRQEVRDALRGAAGDAGLLAELEQGYRSEVRYLERLVSVARF